MKTKLFALLFSAFAFFLDSRAQVIQAPDLQCVITTNASGDITLYWTNPPVNPCGAFVQYTIYASSNGINGPYNPIAITNQSQTSYVYSNAISISNTWYFYMESSYNCPGATVLQSDTVNNLRPETPVIINADVVNGQAVLNWQPSTSPQTYAYVVYYYLSNGNAKPIDTIYGYNVNTYTDVNADPNSQFLTYTVAALDSCWQFSAFNPNPHNTLYLQAATTACQNQVNLNWNRYINWPQGVLDYQVWVSANAGPFTLVTSLDSNSQSYGYSGFNDGDSLCIVIRARSASDSNIVSNSNMVCQRASIIHAPAFLYITNATVDVDNHISVTWTIDPASELIFYKMDRSGNGTVYDHIDQWSVPVPLNLYDTYIDTVNVSPGSNPYYYQVVAYDSCQTEYTTPYVKTISLKGELYDYYVAHLDWNDFELQYATVLHQKLYRNYGNGYQLIKTFQPGTIAYSDSLQQFVAEKGVFCYYVEAEYDLNLPNGYHDTLTSRSNEVCIIHRPIIYIPNAFAPNGVNNVFKPTIIYGNPTGYLMQIFNRYGGKVFESNDPMLGWDGSDHGKDAQAGGYGYLIQFYAEDGVKVERKGMVLLVK